MNDLKRCWKCDTYQQKTNFWKSSARWDGLYPACKPCGKKWNIERDLKDPSKLIATGKKYREKNKDKVKESFAKWYKNNGG